MEKPSHNAVIEESFTRQAEKFDDVRLTLADPKNLGWMTAAIAPSPADEILDVASGTGHLALALAAHAAKVVSFDMTAAMQGKAEEKARGLGLRNVSFALGRAEELPFHDGSFDKAVSRFAFHHFVDPGVVLTEMRRVTKPGGSVVVIDLVSPEDEALRERYDHFERLRDPSHTSALNERAFVAMFERVGVRVVGTHHRTVDVSVERWMDLTDTEVSARASILEAIERDLAGASPTGLFPFRNDGELFFKQNWSIYTLT